MAISSGTLNLHPLPAQALHIAQGAAIADLVGLRESLRTPERWAASHVGRWPLEALLNDALELQRLHHDAAPTAN